MTIKLAQRIQASKFAGLKLIMSRKSFVLFLFISINSSQSFAQKVTYEKGYFRYPMDIQRKLNANFGEMRPNHFHMGLDLFTLRQENIPVYAAAEGYISKIKIETGGFGNAIYIAHPNGTTTLYAHMNGFYPALAKYIREQQYKLESWALDIEIPKGILPVRKGDFIGPSGNTGASQGPHVHFEIRETATDKCLNPLLFDFNIPDAVPPQIHRLAIYDRNKSVYEQSPILVAAVKTAPGRYRANVPTLSFNKVQIAVQATDQMSGVPNQNGFYKSVLYANGKIAGGFTIDRVSYDETRYLNAHIDHRYRASGGPYLQFIMPLKGDKLEIYPYTKPGSFIQLTNSVLPCELEIYDSDGNRSVVEFNLQSSSSGNYYSSSANVMRADEANVFENEDIEVYIPEGMIYDSINFRYSKTFANAENTYSSLHQVHDPKIPVHGAMKVRIRPEKVVPFNLRDRMLIRLKTNTRTIYRKANWSVDKFGAEFRDFGSYQLIADEAAPQISGVSNGMKVGSRITVFVKDNIGPVKNFRGEIDGRWVLFQPRGANYTYVVDERCPPGEHILKISVEDEAGNKTVQQYKIYR